MSNLTPKEAAEQTCPLIRFCVNEGDAVQHQAQPIYVHQNCKGPDCRMGWRWADMDKTVGFCGAFGAPSHY